MPSKRRVSRAAVVAAIVGGALAAVVAATGATQGIPRALTPAAVGPGYPWVAKALAGHKGPAGCTKKFNVWYVNPLPTTPDWGRSAKIFKAAGPLLCYKPTVTGPNKIDIPAMVSQIEDAIAAKADVIVTCTLDPNAFASVMGKARKAGIKLVNVACSAPKSQDIFLGTAFIPYGKSSADTVAKLSGGKAKIGVVMTDATTPNQVAELNAFKSQLKKYPDLSVVDVQYDNSDAGVAAQKISAMLTAHPDVNFIWILEGAAPGAIPSALKEAGKSPGDVKVLAIDLQKPTCLAIKDGWISATNDQVFFDASAYGAKLGIQLKQGKQVPRSIDTGIKVVTKANVPSTVC
jgi:ribose transport system substrate-binding protein